MAKTGYIEEIIQQARKELLQAGVPERRLNVWRASVQLGNICYPGDLPSSGWKRYDGKPMEWTAEEFFSSKMEPPEMWAKLYCIAVAYLDALQSQSADLHILAQEFGALNERLVSGSWGRSKSQHDGSKGGKAGGFKGGRQPKKPFDVELKKAYDTHLAACGSEAEARAQLVKELAAQHKVTRRAASGWLKNIGILGRKSTAR